MYDLVYPVGKGSQWNNMEMRYSLRSVEKHLQEYRNIYIIGELPAFINPKTVKHIFFQDKHSNKERNIMEKFARACIEPKLSGKFLFMNDDYFFTGSATPNNFSLLPHKETLQETYERLVTFKNGYARDIKATLDELTRRELPTVNYDVHKPVLVNKNYLLDKVSEYDWNIPFGYCLRSILFNTTEERSAEREVQIRDVKIDHPFTEAQWKEKEKSFTGTFSVGDQAITFGFKRYLENSYPKKSRFEL